MTVQAQILDLLQDLQREFGSAIIMITHDLGVIAEIADDVLVMYGGRAVETGADQADPHPPGDALHLGAAVAACPTSPATPDARLIPIPGNPPSLLNPPSGCAVPPAVPAHATRCPATCAVTTLPELLPARVGPTHHVKRCHLADPERDLPRRGAAGDRSRPASTRRPARSSPSCRRQTAESRGRAEPRPRLEAERDR